jgi:hypothetical protein
VAQLALLARAARKASVVAFDEYAFNGLNDDDTGTDVKEARFFFKGGFETAISRSLNKGEAHETRYCLGRRHEDEENLTPTKKGGRRKQAPLETFGEHMASPANY